MEDGRLVSISLEAEKEGTFRIENRFETEKLSSRCGGSRQIIDCAVGDIFEVSLGRKESCLISEG